MHLKIRTPDHDALSKLYQENPTVFEELRSRILNGAIAVAPARHRPALQKTLLRIEEARQTAATDMAAVEVAFRMMSDSWSGLEEMWSDMHGESAVLQTILLLERVRKM